MAVIPAHAGISIIDRTERLDTSQGAPFIERSTAEFDGWGHDDAWWKDAPRIRISYRSHHRDPALRWAKNGPPNRKAHTRSPFVAESFRDPPLIRYNHISGIFSTRINLRRRNMPGRIDGAGAACLQPSECRPSRPARPPRKPSTGTVGRSRPGVLRRKKAAYIRDLS
jgi:hypothetical protein